MLKSKSVIELIMCWLNVCVNDLKIKNWKVSWTKMIYAYVMKAMWKVFECIEVKTVEVNETTEVLLNQSYKNNVNQVSQVCILIYKSAVCKK